MSNKGRKPHLTSETRLPRTYKTVERILKQVLNNEASIKTAIFSQKVRPQFIDSVYGMVHHVLLHGTILDNVIEKTQLLIKEPRLRREAAKIMIYEMGIRGTTLPGSSKPVLIIQKYSKEIKDAIRELQNEQGAPVKPRPMPRYARINTLYITVEDALHELEYYEYVKVEYEQNISLKEYHDLVMKLEPWHFLVDYHFKDLLVFGCKENLTFLKLVEEGNIFLQNKASLAPVYALAPEPGSIVLDACAAPGMKTAHLACMMNNTGSIYALDKHKKRFKTLKSVLKRAGVTNCTVSCNDFTSINPMEEPFSSVEYILLDPTCSGSGIVGRSDELTDSEDSKNAARIQGLAGLQIVLLKHALSFPNVKRVVYSTCSTMEEENEYVVEEVLKKYGEYFRIVPALPDWPVRGSSSYEHGSKYFRSNYEENLTNGFFVAVLERIVDGPVIERNYDSDSISDKKDQQSPILKRKRRKNK